MVTFILIIVVVILVAAVIGIAYAASGNRRKAEVPASKAETTDAPPDRATGPD